MARSRVAMNIYDAVNAVEEMLCDPRIFRDKAIFEQRESAFQGLYYLQRKAKANMKHDKSGRGK